MQAEGPEKGALVVPAVEAPRAVVPVDGNRVPVGSGRTGPRSCGAPCVTTKRLDGWSAVAVAVRQWKADAREDLGADLSRAKKTILEEAAQNRIVAATLGDYIARQPSLVNRKRQVLSVAQDDLQVVDALERSSTAWGSIRALS